MKLIIAVVPPTRLEAVKEALARADVFRLTATDVRALGRGASTDGPEAVDRIELRISVNDEFVGPTIGAVLEAARGGPDGPAGDGMIAVLPLDDCIRIRTGERGPEAI